MQQPKSDACGVYLGIKTARKRDALATRAMEEEAAFLALPVDPITATVAMFDLQETCP